MPESTIQSIDHQWSIWIGVVMKELKVARKFWFNISYSRRTILVVGNKMAWPILNPFWRFNRKRHPKTWGTTKGRRWQDKWTCGISACCTWMKRIYREIQREKARSAPWNLRGKNRLFEESQKGGTHVLYKGLNLSSLAQLHNWKQRRQTGQERQVCRQF